MADQGARQHLGSYIDPAGQVYERDGKILRGIRPAFAEFYIRLLNTPSIQVMLGQQLIETVVESDGVEGYPLTLKHRKISPLSFCYEWPPLMLREAALLTLEIGYRLVDHSLELKDASPWNVLFEGTRPVFVDFTSLIPQDPNLLWVAYEQFCRFFLYPLVLSSRIPSKVVRALLLDSINGVTDSDLVQLLPAFTPLRLPWLWGRVYLPRLLLSLVRRWSSDRALATMSARLHPRAEARRAFFRSLQKNIRAIPLRSGRSRWAKYYADLETFFRPAEFDRKQAAVAHILDQCRPPTVVDIGCNLGGYAILAARAGARVTAFDTDDDSASLLYKVAHEKQLDILPLVIDVLNPSPACGWRAIQFPPSPQRFRSDMAMALALVHHLAITQRQTFERIVPALADYADRWLLTEFVPLDDPRSQELLASNRRDMSWYSLDAFTVALKREFGRVETFPSHPDQRTLVLCTRA